MPGVDPAFDGRGLFLRGETGVAGVVALRWESRLMRDAVLSLGPADCASDVARGRSLVALRWLREDPGTRFVDIPALHAATVAPDPVFDLLHDARRDPADGADPDPLSADDLMDDARQAWTFFERFSVAATGLCIDTADVQEGGEWLQREMTMWDIGSLIAAVMAAHDLGLIGDAAFAARCARLVEALPVARIGGLGLPAEVISSDTGAALSGDFNACDTGRLLSVLRDLDRHPLTRGLDPLGAEPLLLEAVEMGLSEPTALLADVLSFAQQRDHARTGTLYCVSEAPINREPWFSYQGLNVASPTERWVVNAASADPASTPPRFGPKRSWSTPRRPTSGRRRGPAPMPRCLHATCGIARGWTAWAFRPVPSRPRARQCPDTPMSTPTASSWRRSPSSCAAAGCVRSDPRRQRPAPRVRGPRVRGPQVRTSVSMNRAKSSPCEEMPSLA